MSDHVFAEIAWKAWWQNFKYGESEYIFRKSSYECPNVFDQFLSKTKKF